MVKRKAEKPLEPDDVSLDTESDELDDNVSLASSSENSSLEQDNIDVDADAESQEQGGGPNPRNPNGMHPLFLWAF